jgi:SPP1 family predicted phage head-tail adaptor
MRAGLLRDTITFLRPVKVDTDYSGGEVEYCKAFSTRARAEHNSGNKVIDGGEVFSSCTVKFSIHHYHQVTPDMVIVCRKQRYRILDINPRYSQMDIVLTTEMTDG